MGMLRVTLPKCVYIHIHRHVFHLSQDLSVWLGLTSREQLMSPEWSKHQVLSFSIYIAMYFIYIYIYIHWWATLISPGKDETRVSAYTLWIYSLSTLENTDENRMFLVPSPHHKHFGKAQPLVLWAFWWHQFFSTS